MTDEIIGRLVRLALCLWLSLMAVIWGARVAGRMQPIPSGVLDLHLLDCPPPCWIGIVPGVTTIAEAKAKMVALYQQQMQMTIKDSGHADGPVYDDRVENTIESDDFYLLVRLNFSGLVDGRSEIVQSIGLFASRRDESDAVPTVADILAVLGRPQGAIIEELLNGGYEMTLKYNGLDAVFYSSARQTSFRQIPRLYLGYSTAPDPSTTYRPWQGWATLMPGR